MNYKTIKLKNEYWLVKKNNYTQDFYILAFIVFIREESKNLAEIIFNCSAKNVSCYII